MNSLEQIKLEREIKQELQQYGRQTKKPEKYTKLDQKYSDDNPADIGFWHTVWDTYERPYDTGIPEEMLYQPTSQATGKRKSKAKEAVKAGKEFDRLVEDEPAEDVEFDKDGDTTFLRPVLPEERPDLYVDNAEAFADRDVWEGVWEAFGQDKDQEILEPAFENVCKSEFGCEKDAELEAVIAVGKMCNAISEEKGIYSLSSERPDDFWLEVWEQTFADVDEPTERKFINMGIVSVTDLSREEADERIDQAIERGEIYSPPDEHDTKYKINDPSSDEGPEIGTVDDDDDDSDGGQYDDSGDGDDGDDSGATTESHTSGEDTPTDHTGPSTTSDQQDPTDDTTTPGEPDPTNKKKPPRQTAESGSKSEANTQSESGSESGPDVKVKSSSESGGETGAESPSKSDTESAQSELSNESSQTSTDDRRGDREDRSLEEGEPGGSVNFEGGVDLREVMDEEDIEEGIKDGDTDAEQPGDDTNDESGTTRFHTYEEPDLDNPAINVDIDAVHQFIDDFAETEDADDWTLAVEKDTFMNAFDEWAKINDIDLDELSKDEASSTRKGNMKSILNDIANAESKRVTIEEERVMGFIRIELSESGYELIHYE